MSLNPVKCAVGVTSGTLLGHIVRGEGIVVDLDKMKVVIEAPPPTNVMPFSRFLGQILWHSPMITYLDDVATALHGVVHKTSFQWSIVEQDACKHLFKEDANQGTSRTTT